MSAGNRRAAVRPLLESLLAAYQRRFGERLISVALYGSVARGTATGASDVDLLVVAEGLPRSVLERDRVAIEIERGLRPLRDEISARTGWQPYLSTLLVTSEEASCTWRPYFDMTIEAEILFDRGGFLRGVLDRVARRLAELGARRIVLPDGRWYWDLKPDFRWGEVIEI